MKAKIARLEESEISLHSIIEQLKKEMVERDRQLDQVSQDNAIKENEVMDLQDKLEELGNPNSLVGGNFLLILNKFALFSHNIYVFKALRTNLETLKAIIETAARNPVPCLPQSRSASVSGHPAALNKEMVHFSSLFYIQGLPYIFSTFSGHS